jgi:hypothetical protein
MRQLILVEFFLVPIIVIDIATILRRYRSRLQCRSKSHSRRIFRSLLLTKYWGSDAGSGTLTFFAFRSRPSLTFGFTACLPKPAAEQISSNLTLELLSSGRIRLHRSRGLGSNRHRCHANCLCLCLCFGVLVSSISLAAACDTRFFSARTVSTSSLCSYCAFRQ